MVPNMSTSDVIIIGAGLSGLSAAKLLTERGIDVLVLEARDRVGGRTFTVKNGDCGWVDLGASYVGETQNHILRLARDLGLKTFRVYDEQKHIHISQGRKDVYESLWPKFSWRNPLAAQEVEYVLNLLDTMSLEVPADKPWDAENAEEWDSMSLQEFYNIHCQSEESQEFLQANCQSNVSSDPSQISLLWYLLYLRSTGGNQKIWTATNGGQERKFEGGTMQISEKMQQMLGDKVKLGEAVFYIEQGKEGVTIRTIKGSVYKTKHVIMAIPLPLLQKIHYEPPLPSLKTQLIQRVTMGTTIKCEIYYKKPFWRELGLSGFVTCGDGIDVVCNSIDDCKPGSKYGQLTCFVVSDKAIEMQALTMEERCKKVAEFLYKAFNNEEALRPVHYIDKNWTSEQYTGGCYTCTFPPGVLSKYGRTLREPFSAIYFAGTETATEWTGYMNGAVEAGERAAREIMHARGLIPKEGIWVKEPKVETSVTDKIYNPSISTPYMGEQPPQLYCKL